jgi:hypothetical protein
MGGSVVVGVVGVAVVAVGVADVVVAGVNGGGCCERKDRGCGKSSATCSAQATWVTYCYNWDSCMWPNSLVVKCGRFVCFQKTQV